jgi:hypothetical protein
MESNSKGKTAHGFPRVRTSKAYKRVLNSAEELRERCLISALLGEILGRIRHGKTRFSSL